MGICYSLWKLPGREMGTHTHLLARLSQVSEGGGPASAPACPGFSASVRTFLCWFGKCLDSCSGKKGGEKLRREKPGCGGPANTRKGGKKQTTPPQTNPNSTPKCSHYRRTKKSKDGAAHQAGNWCALPPAPLLLGTRRRRRFQAPEPTSFIWWVSLTLLEPGGKEKRERKSHKN